MAWVAGAPRYNGQPIIAANWDRVLGTNKIIGPVVLRQSPPAEELISARGAA